MTPRGSATGSIRMAARSPRLVEMLRARACAGKARDGGVLTSSHYGLAWPQRVEVCQPRQCWVLGLLVRPRPTTTDERRVIVARTIAVASQKGGVGKTTTVASLGVALAELGEEVLLVDLDPQACLTFSLGLDPELLQLALPDVLAGRVGLRDVITATEEGVDLVPSTIALAQSEAAMLTGDASEYVLKRALVSVLDHYDWILLDCPPTLGVLTVNALTAADEVLVPLQCETLAHRGVGQVVETVLAVTQVSNPRLRILGVLPTMYDSRTAHARAVLADIAGRYDMPVLDPPIPRSVRFAEAPALGRSVLSTSPGIRGVEAYRTHAQWLLAAARVEPSR